MTLWVPFTAIEIGYSFAQVISSIKILIGKDVKTFLAHCARKENNYFSGICIAFTKIAMHRMPLLCTYNLKIDSDCSKKILHLLVKL